MLWDIISSGRDSGGADGADHLLIEALARVIERQRGEALPRSGNPIERRLESVCFRALVEMIESNSGVGFVNADQGHPAYAMGRRGKIDAVAGGDGPEGQSFVQGPATVRAGAPRADTGPPDMAQVLLVRFFRRLSVSDRTSSTDQRPIAGKSARQCGNSLGIDGV